MKRIPHAEWPTVLLHLMERFEGAPTTIRLRDHHIEEHEQGLARSLPLASLEFQLRPKEMLRIGVTQSSGSLETVEIEYPKNIYLFEESAKDEFSNGVALQIETAASTYFVHLDLPTH